MGFTYPPVTPGVSADALPVVSSTSLSISAGSKTFAVAAGSRFYVGKFYRAYNTANPAQYIDGICTATTSTSLTLNIDFFIGSGTVNNWLIDISPNVLVTTITTDVVSSVITFVDVTDLSVNLLANITYQFEFIGMYQTVATTTGGAVKFNISNTPTYIFGKWYGSVASVTNAAVATELAGALSAAGTFTTSGLSVINTPSYIGCNGKVKMAADSTMTLQWASEVAASNSQLNTNSTISFTRLI